MKKEKSSRKKCNRCSTADKKTMVSPIGDTIVIVEKISPPQSENADEK